MADRRNHPQREALVRRIAGEFTEMPCLRLTPAQARRLFALRADICDRILAALVREGVLIFDHNGRYGLDERRLWSPRSRAPLRRPDGVLPYPCAM